MLKTSYLQPAAVALSFTFLLGCGPRESSSTSTSSLTHPSDNLTDSNPNSGHANKGICSNLDFMGFSWPSDMFEFEKEALEVALNITGSFEGFGGWQNLTNDFDGQGLSMGLMNQTLGTGSLQPLLLKMRQLHFDKFQSLFQADHFQSLMTMLSNWENSNVRQSSSEVVSPLDLGSPELSANEASAFSSVEWARRTIYDSPGVFNPIWKNELLKLASSHEYVSLQINAAWDLHLRALALHKMMAVYELRTYLLMFDIVVQNGNLKPEDEVDYRNYVRHNPRATAQQRLEKIVNLRLRWVKPQYRNDVRARKMSLINGFGQVHGVSRQYEKEFCFNRKQIFPRRPTPLP